MIIEDPNKNTGIRIKHLRKDSVGRGIIFALIGLFIYRWASNHSPNNPLRALMVQGMDAYVLKEPVYTMILLLAAGLILLGISRIIVAIINQSKVYSASPQKTETINTILDKKFCTECGKQNREQARFVVIVGSLFRFSHSHPL